MMVYGDYLREVGYAAQKIGLTWDNVSDAVVCPSRQATLARRAGSPAGCCTWALGTVGSLL